MIVFLSYVRAVAIELEAKSWPATKVGHIFTVHKINLIISSFFSRAKKMLRIASKQNKSMQEFLNCSSFFFCDLNPRSSACLLAVDTFSLFFFFSGFLPFLLFNFSIKFFSENVEYSPANILLVQFEFECQLEFTTIFLFDDSPRIVSSSLLLLSCCIHGSN